MGCFLFLLLLYNYATHFDTFHTNSGRIYRVIDHVKSQSGGEATNALTPMPWGPALKASFPQVEQYVRFLLLGKMVTHDHESFNTGVIYTDPSIFDVFTFPLAQGDMNKALDGPNKAVLTQQTAKMLFGEKPPLGNVIKIDRENYVVTGVLKKIPPQSSLTNNFSVLVSSSNLNKTNFPPFADWNDHSIETYLLMKKGADVSRIVQQMPAFLSRHIGEKAAVNYSPSFQLLTDMYLGGSMMNDYHDTLDKSYIYIFLTIGFMILLISCINFINISTARASKRNREVGMRKVIGATGGQLVFQYLFEVLIVTLFALFLANVLIEVMLTPFNALSEWQVEIGYTHNTFVWIAMIGIVAFVTFMAGGYPAFYLSRFQPARIFRTMSSGSRKSLLRSGLVVTQFTLAVFMLLCALVVKSQIHYLHNKDLGYNKTGVMRILHSGNIREAKKFRNEILQNPLIRSVSLSSNGPFSPGTAKTYTVAEGDRSEENLMHTFYVDDQYIPLLNLKIKEGRNFSRNIASDSINSVIVNEAAVKALGWQNEDPLGKTIQERTEDGTTNRLTVVGVIRNFNFEALDQPIKPLVLLDRPSHSSMIIVKVDPDHLTAATHFINQTWKKDFPEQFLYYEYIDAQIKQWYTTESVISKMLSFITYLTIFIACLGLLGLAAYATLQRAREISVRKVLGATVREIVTLLSIEFMRYVVLALIVGLPLAYFAVSMWLNNFVYHATIGLWPIVIVTITTVCIAWLTICWQTIRAAFANPAKNLRNE